VINGIFALSVITAAAFGLYALFNIRSQLTPLVSLAVLVTVITVFGMLGMLSTGVIAAELAGIAIFAVAFAKNRNSIGQKIRGFFTPGVILFMGASVAMLIFLYVRQPVMNRWDEFSFWGMSQKLVKMHGQLYTYISSSMLGQSIPPSLAVLSYFFQRHTARFIEWMSYFAYDVLFFACFCAFTAVFDSKNWHKATAFFMVGFFLPYIFEITTLINHLEPLYITVYSDIPLALTFAGCYAVYYFSDNGDSRDIIPVLSVLMFLTLIKDMGLALGCIVLFIAFFDMLVGRKQFSYLKVKGFAGKVLAAFSMLAVTGGSFVGWSMHIGKVLAVNRTDFGGEAGMGMVQMLLTGVQELLIGPESEKFTTVKALMTDALFTKKVSMFGSSVVVIGIISVVFAVAFVLSDKTGRKRTAMMYVTGWTGFIGYYIFHLFLYVYVFRNDAYNLASYDRYMYVYYIPWLLIGLFCLCTACVNGYRKIATAAVLAFACGIIMIFNYYVDAENTFLCVNEYSYSQRVNMNMKIDYLKDVIEKDDVIYIHTGGDDGERWFRYTFELAENYIAPEPYIEIRGFDSQRAKEKYQSEMHRYFKEKGITHVLMDSIDSKFGTNMNELFDVSVLETGMDSVSYYKVNYTDTGFYFTLIKGGKVCSLDLKS